MSKSSFILGLLLAVGAHVLLFLPIWSAPQTPQSAKKENQRVELARRLDPPPPIEPEQVPPPPEPEPAPQPQTPPRPEPEQQRPAPEPEELQEVHQPPEQPEPRPEETPPGETIARRAEEISDDALPPLRIVWSSPDQLRAVAAGTGMRVVGVNTLGEIIGQVPSRGPVRLEEFTGRLGRFSNRVRTLPRNFFGQVLTRQDGQSVAELWVLVPSRLDRQWISLQKRAIATAGVETQAVRAVEGQFATRSGAFQLVVTRLVGAGS